MYELSVGTLLPYTARFPPPLSTYRTAMNLVGVWANSFYGKRGINVLVRIMWFEGAQHRTWRRSKRILEVFKTRELEENELQSWFDGQSDNSY